MKDDRGGAIDLLLETWAEAASVAVADAIDALDALLEQPAFTGEIDAWTETARQPKPFERGPRIRAIADHPNHLCRRAERRHTRPSNRHELAERHHRNHL